MNARAFAVSLTLVCGVAAGMGSQQAYSQESLQVTPGQWESVVTLNSNILGSRTQTETECLTESEIDPRKMLEGMPANECDFQSSITGNGSVMNFTISCNTDAGPLAGQGRFEVIDDTSTGTVSLEGNMAGMALQMEITSTGKRIGDC